MLQLENLKVKTETSYLVAVMVGSRTPTCQSSDVRPLQLELRHVKLTETYERVFKSTMTNSNFS